MNTTIKPFIIIALALAATPAAQAQPATPNASQPADDECRIPAERRGNTDWFRDAGWGVFVHWLYKAQCSGDHISRMDGEDDWNKCVNEFDTEKFAAQLKDCGAKYVIFTMMQHSRYLPASNATYDRLTGYKPGGACSTRDLVEDLYTSLHKRGIKRMLYWTGDGPLADPQAASGLEYGDGRPVAFVQKWADVVAEYGNRYRDKVAGWWCDGCYASSGYNEEKWTILAKGLRAGNPKRIIALNDIWGPQAASSTLNNDFTPGEWSNFGEVPDSR